VLDKWLEGVKFLKETLFAGLDYANATNTKKENEEEDWSLNFNCNAYTLTDGLLKSINLEKILFNDIQTAFLDEETTNSLYLEIKASIEVYQKTSGSAANHCIDGMYIPIRDWLEDIFRYATCSSFVHMRYFLPRERIKLTFYLKNEML
jgi:hypothetical protein